MVGKGRFELPTSRSRTVHSNLAELLPEPPDSTTALSGVLRPPTYNALHMLDIR
jgi:hypothetical protein